MRAALALCTLTIACRASPAPISATWLNVDAGVLRAAYDANGIAADQQYGRATLTVAGYVQAVDTDILGDPFVVLVEPADALSGVQAMFADADPLASLQKGQRIVVTCRTNSGYLALHVVLRDCTLRP